jgi:NDP-sugar pyrophosphorylase family protein
MGFLKVGPEVRPKLMSVIEALLAGDGRRTAGVPQLLNRLVEEGQAVEAIYTTGHWLDVDSLSDVVRAWDFRKGSAAE